MITRVERGVQNEDGETVRQVLHDCEEAGCDISWDGYNRVSGKRVKRAPELPAHELEPGGVAVLAG